MSKTVKCPAARYAGTVTFSDPILMPQSVTWQRALRTAQNIDQGTSAEFNAALLPGVFAIVEKWELAGLEEVTPETFPASPQAETDELIAWLINQIVIIFTGSGEVKDPNE